VRKCVSEDAALNTSKRNQSYKEQSERINIHSFDMIRQIGKGAYGKVWLVRKKDTKDEYAMKLIR
jgi:serine/threonine protein kinase